MSGRSPVVERSVGIGIIGANSYVAKQAVMPAIDASRNAHVAATASRSGSVPDRWIGTEAADYDDVLTSPDVDAVYIPLPNGMHREWTEKAAAAGKHVLCEKPLAPDATSAVAMAAACAEAGVLLAEAWMTPFDRRWSTTIELLRSGAIGDVLSQHHSFTFTIGPEASDNYRWDPEQGGGALLDVGVYTLGTAVELWGSDCTIEAAHRTIAPSGVDASTAAWLTWSGGRTAEIHCSFVDEERQSAVFSSDHAHISLDDAAFTSGHDLDHVISRHGVLSSLPPIDLAEHAPRRMPQTTPNTEIEAGADAGAEQFSKEQFSIEPGNPYQSMVEAFADAVLGRAEWPRPIGGSIQLLQLIERINDHPNTEASCS